MRHFLFRNPFIAIVLCFFSSALWAQSEPGRMLTIADYPPGVSHYDAAHAAGGFTLLAPYPEIPLKAQKNGFHSELINMQGQTVHEFSFDLPPMSAQLLPDGHVLAMVQLPIPAEELKQAQEKGESVAQLVRSSLAGVAWGACIEERDWDSQLLFKVCDNSMSHDMAKLSNGHYVYLSNEAIDPNIAKRVQGGIPYKDAMQVGIVQEVDASGKRVASWHAQAHLDPKQDVLPPTALRDQWDHLNTIFPMDNNQFMVSSYYMAKLFIVDKKTGRVTHRINGDLMSFEGGQFHFNPHFREGTFFQAAHNCQILQANQARTLLCFDNGILNGVSRGVEFELDDDFQIKKVLWSTQHDFIRGRPAFSLIIGGIQKLDNGNYLINYGTEGVIEEQTPSHEVVWRYSRVSPNLKAQAPWAFFRAYRYGRDYAPQLKHL